MFPPFRNRFCLRILFSVISITFFISIIRMGSKRKKFQTQTSIYPSVEDDEWELDDENIPDLPIILGPTINGPRHYNLTCAKLPDLYKIQFSNIHWQLQITAEENYYFYSAYLDIRGLREGKLPDDTHNLSGALVRILAMSDGYALSSTNSSLKVCQLWYKKRTKPQFGQISEVKMLWNVKWGAGGHYFPYLITCKPTSNFDEVPASVSLVENKCDDATNNLIIMHSGQVNKLDASGKPVAPPREFGVCVKALDFPDGSDEKYKLIEWIEMLRLLGADKIFFYDYYVDSNIMKILKYYENTGFVNVQQITLPGKLPNHPQLRHLYIRGKRLDKRLTELIPYNDCLYRHMYDFKYILVIDTDEIIIPQEEMKWSDLLNLVNERDLTESEKKLQMESNDNFITTYCFRNFYFLDGMLTGKENNVEEIPKDFHMLRHVFRSNESTGTKYMKCFHKTASTLGVHNHFAFFCREKNCKRHYVKLERAQMNHYRSSCVKDIKNCTQYMQGTVKDEKVWRYKDTLISRVHDVINAV